MNHRESSPGVGQARALGARVGLDDTLSLATEDPCEWAYFEGASDEPRRMPLARSRAALLRGDARGMERAIRAMSGEGRWFCDGAIASHGWRSWLIGDETAMVEACQELKGSPVAGFRIDGLLLESLSALPRDVGLALTLAERAYREANGRGLRHWEFLSGLVFARCRRFAKESLSAKASLRSLAATMPLAYRQWHAWESLLATGPMDPVFDERVDEGFQRWRLHQPFRADAMAVRALRSQSESAYARGLCHDAPRGLAPGLRGALVYGEVGRARRIWCESAPPKVDFDLRALEASRIASLICCLALDAGLSNEEVFQHTYGLTYRRSRHRQSFRVLLHRARKSIEPYGLHIVDSDGSLRLTPGGTIAVYDPRTQLFEDAALVELFHRVDRVTSKEVAAILSVPRRTAQYRLRRLMRHGALQCRNTKGSFEYRIANDIFAESSPPAIV